MLKKKLKDNCNDTVNNLHDIAACKTLSSQTTNTI